MMAGAPDYQFLKDFIDTMIGILFILFILKFTLICIKYVLSPIGLLFRGLFMAKDSLKTACKDYVDKQNEETNKASVKNIIENNKTGNTDSDNSSNNSNVIDFNKLRKK